MFPDFDADVIASVHALSGDLEQTIQQLLEMGGAPPEPRADDFPAHFGGGAQLNSDEELAFALFQQFAEDPELDIPPEAPRRSKHALPWSRRP
jgi:hypothetical protein